MEKCRYQFIRGKVPQGRHIINRRFQPAEKKHLRSKSRRDDILSIHNVVPAGLWGESRAFLVRRLKSTVNNISSLRDFSSNNPISTFCHRHDTKVVLA